MSNLDRVHIRHTALGNRIVLARVGKDSNVALDTRDVQSEFWKALVSLAFDGKMPEPGQGVEIDFGGGDEQFTCIVKRKEVTN